MERNKILDDAILDSYNRIVCPLIKRELRAELKRTAEKASIEVFSGNLKQLLLGVPLRSKCILGIDPGFMNGCKLAVISETGSVLKTDVIYPHGAENFESVEKIKQIVLKYNCDIIALGNGTACRETEAWLSELITNNIFNPLDVAFTIVSEDGASIYSCSTEAKKEFPDLDTNVVSAVSLARRLQDPLSELVKIEPRHLGVGMYQHDLPPKRLEEALNDVVSECVSFVGADINTASHCLLRHIAGLTDKRATEIINYREKNGPFKTRENLKKVKGIGEHTFQQCAGFLKVLNAKDTSQKLKSSNLLDNTIIHPESYALTQKIVSDLNLKTENIGKPEFITKIKEEEVKIKKEFDASPENLELIFDGLSKPLNHDVRSDYDIKPLFRNKVRKAEDLTVGTNLTGRVINVTHFGAFMDVGVGTGGLIHISKMRGATLNIGDHIEVKVISLELERKRIGLEFVKRV